MLKTPTIRYIILCNIVYGDDYYRFSRWGSARILPVSGTEEGSVPGGNNPEVADASTLAAPFPGFPRVEEPTPSRSPTRSRIRLSIRPPRFRDGRGGGVAAEFEDGIDASIRPPRFRDGRGRKDAEVHARFRASIRPPRFRDGRVAHFRRAGRKRQRLQFGRPVSGTEEVVSTALYLIGGKASIRPPRFRDGRVPGDDETRDMARGASIRPPRFRDGRAGIQKSQLLQDYSLQFGRPVSGTGREGNDGKMGNGATSFNSAAPFPGRKSATRPIDRGIVRPASIRPPRFRDGRGSRWESSCRSRARLQFGRPVSGTEESGSSAHSGRRARRFNSAAPFPGRKRRC